MPVYQYEAFTSNGTEEDGIVEADSPREAREMLRNQDLHITTLEPTLQEEEDQEQSFVQSLFSGISQSELVNLTRQLATLLRAGVPLTEGLTALIDQTESRNLETVLRDVRDQVRQGSRLADALERHPNVFNQLYVAMIRSGEASGELDSVLQRLGEYLHSRNQIRSRIIAALTYPVFIILVGVIVCIFLFTAVMPQIIQLLQNQNKALPLPTEILWGISLFIQSYWLLLILGLCALCFAVYSFLKTERGKYLYDLMLLKIPFLGSFVRKAAISRFSATLATLLESGLPIMKSLEVVENLLDNQVMARTIHDIREEIMGGSNLSDPLRDAPFFPSTLSYMIGIGEESGEVEKLLRQISDAYDEEIELAAEQFTSLLQPILIILIAFGVGFVAFAIILPLLQMSQM